MIRNIQKTGTVIPLQKTAVFLLLLSCMVACKDKYMPNINVPSRGYLVVEGTIDAGGGPTTMMLSRASGLDTILIINERGAQVEVESINGESYQLINTDSGRYTIDQIAINALQKYRLHIKTANGEEYVSDYADVKISPPIDTVTWSADASQVTVYVTTHDNSDSSRYYFWQYEDTWQYNAAFRSPVIVTMPSPDHYTIVGRPVDQALPHTCWKTQPSNRILIASSDNLHEDVISNFPIESIPFASSNKLVQRFSMLVKQKVLTREAYEWNQKIQKNTEQIGSIFDAQPSETAGNIHCISNPVQPVVGFISCSSTTVKRIFIDRSQLAPSVNTGYQDCELSMVDLGGLYNPLPDLYEQSNQFVLTDFSNNTVSIAPIDCVDCRLRGGAATPPPFWQ